LHQSKQKIPTNAIKVKADKLGRIRKKKINLIQEIHIKTQSLNSKTQQVSPSKKKTSLISFHKKHLKTLKTFPSWMTA
jgi:hypothetical protein